MFHISFYNQFYPIIIPQQQSVALSLNSNKFQLQSSMSNNGKKKTTSKAVTGGKQSKAQRQALKDGLEKSLDSTNKGFEILKKMGYEEGRPLGKCGSGIVEPLAIAVRDKPHDRAGLGREVVSTTGKKNSSTKKGAKKDPSAKSNPTKVPAIKAEKEDETPAKQSTSSSSPSNSTKREKRLQQLQLKHRSDIDLLRLRLEAEVSLKSKNSMVIAMVAITGEKICAKVFEIIHQYLVNSLHVYTGSPFPMFHDIAHVDDEIKVVCEDESSFNYLATCITALSSNLAMTMTTTRVPPIGSSLYWFAVQMPGLVNGPQSFLSQIKKHRFELKPDRWIIVTQQPCQKTNKTNLQIITDEHSAMLLIFRHCMKLFVCMQEMEFALRGKFPFP